ncbi:hypothetical protein FRC08_004313, partial [Ceratobasidium sp. 394]
RDNAANAASANREPPLPYPPPATFIPIHTANLDSHIGLLHPFYASRAGGGAPPPTDGGPVGAVLTDDPINPLKVKMGPLGQIVPVVANTGKKKGGGGGGGGSGGAGTGTGAVPSGGPTDTKPDIAKDSKKKKAKAPVPVSTEPPLTMPTFGVSRAPAMAPSLPEVSTMMPDFSAFINGGVPAGV